MNSQGQPAQPSQPQSESPTAVAHKVFHPPGIQNSKKVGQVGQGTRLTIHAIEQAIFALPFPSYLIRIIDSATGRCAFNDEWRAGRLVRPSHADFLRARNAHGGHIYFRPSNRRHVLLDDIDAATLDRLAADGLTPALVIETSPENLQVWITFSGQDLLPSEEAAIASELARRYGGDPGAAHRDQFGRLPGFRNRKIDYRSPTGGFPLVKIVRRIRPGVAPGAATFVQSLAAVSDQLPPPSPPSLSPGGLCSSSTMTPEEAKEIYNYTASLILDRFGTAAFSNDRSRLDFAVARNLVLNRFEQQDIEAVLSLASEKAIERGEDYVKQTVESATVDQLEVGQSAP